MAASKQTCEDIMAVLRRHLDVNQRQEILHDLLAVVGNTSFMDTVTRLCVMADEEWTKAQRWKET